MLNLFCKQTIIFIQSTIQCLVKSNNISHNSKIKTKNLKIKIIKTVKLHTIKGIKHFLKMDN